MLHQARSHPHHLHVSQVDSTISMLFLLHTSSFFDCSFPMNTVHVLSLSHVETSRTAPYFCLPRTPSKSPLSALTPTCIAWPASFFTNSARDQTCQYAWTPLRQSHACTSNLQLLHATSSHATALPHHVSTSSPTCVHQLLLAHTAHVGPDLHSKSWL